MNPRRVVITGLGPVTPIGIGAGDFWNALLDGRSAVRRIQSFDPARFDSQVAGEIESISVADYMPKAYRKSKKMMARDIEMAVIAAHQAVQDAGLRTKCLIDRGEAEAPPNIDPTRFGANIGAGLICADLPELAEALSHAAPDGDFSMALWGSEGMHKLTPIWLLKFLPNMLACHVTIVHDAQGPSNTITCGEASSHLAIGEAFRTIARGRADVCVCGGAESKINPMALLRQSLGRRLSRHNETPESACRPFAADRDGTVIGEGGGLVILEELDHAKARGARIYAELVGFGASNDAYNPENLHEPEPTGRGLRLACEKALADAKVAAGDVQLIGASGFGLPTRDHVEGLALATLGDSETPTLSVKGGIGSNGAGSGAIDFIAAVLSMYNGAVPPAINSAKRDPDIKLRLVTGKPIDARVDVAVSTSFALNGGQNAALVLKRYRAQ